MVKDTTIETNKILRELVKGFKGLSEQVANMDERFDGLENRFDTFEKDSEKFRSIVMDRFDEMVTKDEFNERVGKLEELLDERFIDEDAQAKKITEDELERAALSGQVSRLQDWAHNWSIDKKEVFKG